MIMIMTVYHNGQKSKFPMVHLRPFQDLPFAVFSRHSFITPNDLHLPQCKMISQSLSFLIFTYSFKNYLLSSYRLYSTGSNIEAKVVKRRKSCQFSKSEKHKNNKQI